MRTLVSTLSTAHYPFERLEEFAENGESLEVHLSGVESARPRNECDSLWERWADFLPFTSGMSLVSLGEGHTPLLHAGKALAEYTGVGDLLLKNETQNPTGSFKDRGSVFCAAMAKECGEAVTATISTGNMGHSMAAYAARSGLKSIIFVPYFAPREKLLAMAVHGADVVRVHAPDYSLMKRELLSLAASLSLRMVSGNGPIRVEGYKLTAFELYDQLHGAVPDFIAVPTSACGHIRGIFKGFRELMQAGLADRLPQMILVQAANNAPLVTAIKRGLQNVVPFANFHTVAEAITTGNPMGGNELIAKAKAWNWLAEAVTEEEIIDSQQRLARSGFFVEPAAATSLAAVRKLRASNQIRPDANVVIVLTGSGLKDMEVIVRQKHSITEVDLDSARGKLAEMLRSHD